MPGPALDQDVQRQRAPRRFLRDTRGAVAVELGLLAMPFFILLGAILETAVLFLSSQLLESAVQDSSRLIRTGQVQTQGMTQADFRADLCSRLHGLFGDCSGIFISVTPLSDFTTATAPAPVDLACSANCSWTRAESWSPGAGSSYVMVQAYYRWPVILGRAPFASDSLPDGTRLLGSAYVFRSEPFS